MFNLRNLINRKPSDNTANDSAKKYGEDIAKFNQCIEREKALSSEYYPKLYAAKTPAEREAVKREKPSFDNIAECKGVFP